MAAGVRDADCPAVRESVLGCKGRDLLEKLRAIADCISTRAGEMCSVRGSDSAECCSRNDGIRARKSASIVNFKYYEQLEINKMRGGMEEQPERMRASM